jgi:RNA polymerase sigma factor (sigma-70 family)
MPSLEKTFVTELKAHQNIVHKVCRVYAKEAADHQDLFQEITLQAWKAFPQFRGEAKFSTWLYRVALNTAITFFRKEKKRPVHFSAEGMEFAQVTDTEALEEKSKALYQAIAELGNIDKALIMLYLEDFNHTEIGECLGISANHVAVKLSRIKSKLTQKANHYLAHA